MQNWTTNPKCQLINIKNLKSKTWEQTTKLRAAVRRILIYITENINRSITMFKTIKRNKLTDLTKNGVNRVHGHLILRGITDETLTVSETNVRRRGSVSLVIGYDLNTVVLPHTNARVCGAEIDSDRWPFTFSGHCSLVCDVSAEYVKEEERSEELLFEREEEDDAKLENI